MVQAQVVNKEYYMLPMPKIYFGKSQDGNLVEWNPKLDGEDYTKALIKYTDYMELRKEFETLNNWRGE